MKPVRLEVQGLQSYIEPVVIDFDTLGRYGLFGIFGPIGSGKSSLLDALTLALYGLVDRVSGRSKRGVINVDAPCMEVRLIFTVSQAGGGVERYEVHRRYRSTSDGTGVQRVASRLLQHTEGGHTCDPPLVLADKEREVNDRVADIVGLCAEDFMRAVVLPQGRFLDVLHLKGSERRGMLQRIFRLSAYGAQLRQKLRARQQDGRERLASIDGELVGLGPATRADVREAKAQLETQRIARGEAAKALRVAREAHEAAGRARRQHAHLADARAQLAQLAEEQPAHDARAAALAEAEALHPQRGLVSRWRRARERAQSAGERSGVAASSHAEATAACHAAEQVHEAARQQHEALAPALEQRLRALDELSRRLNDPPDLDDQVARSERRAHDTRERRVRIDASLDEARAELSTVDTDRRKLRRKVAKVRVGLEERRHVAEALAAHQQLTSARAHHDRATEAHHAAEDALRATEAEVQRAKASVVEVQVQLKEAEEQRAAIVPVEPPAAPLIDLGQERIEALSACVATQREAQAILDASLKQLAGTEEAFALAQEELAAAEEAFEDARQALAIHQAEHTAAELARTLSESEPCPVCGSEAHPAPAPGPSGEAPSPPQAPLAERESTASWARELSARRATVAAHEAEAARSATQVVDAQTALAELVPFEGFPEAHLQEAREALQAAGAQLERSHAAAQARQDATEVLHRLQVEAERAFVPVRAAEAQLERAERDVASAHAALDAASAELGVAWSSWSEVAGERTTLFDVPQLQRRIDDRDAEARDLEQALATAEARREQLQQAIADAQHDRSGAVADVAEAVAQHQQLHERWTALLAVARAELGELPSPPAPAGEEHDEEPHPISASSLREQVRIRRDTLNERLRVLSATLAEAAERREATQRAAGEARTMFATAEAALLGAEEALREAWSAWVEVAPELSSYDPATGSSGPGDPSPLAPTTAEALDSLEARIQRAPPPEELAEWRASLEAHRRQRERLEARVDALSADGATPPTHEAFAALGEQLESAQIEAEATSDATSRAEAAHDDLVQRLSRVRVLQREREHAASELDQLGHLGGLLRGDRFVEFVANDLLRDLAATATRHLRVLSEGRYALVLDDQGGFQVQDADAGGTTRPVTSLSGGESFLSALALALALSTQIQARGARPLEFFFLDEGFGSLDPEALDRVMSAIERLRDGHRVIGLISHVPGVRERVPMHLIVHPAGKRQQGSSVELRMQ